MFRFSLVRQWIHARVSQGCSGLAGFASYDAPRAVFFDSGRCKAGFVFAVFLLASTGPSFWLRSVMDLKDIFPPWRSRRCSSWTSLTCPLCSETGMHSPTVQRTSKSHRCSSCADGYDGPDSASHCLDVDIPVLAQTWWLTFLFTRSDEFQLSFWTAEV